MDAPTRQLCKELRQASSHDAADRLLNDASIRTPLVVIGHRSWKREDQMRLAHRFLAHLPHASPIAYEAFLSFMSVGTFLTAIEEHLPVAKGREDLLWYYLRPSLDAAAKSNRTALGWPLSSPGTALDQSASKSPRGWST
jgi:hypothetical protein